MYVYFALELLTLGHRIVNFLVMLSVDFQSPLITFASHSLSSYS